MRLYEVKNGTIKIDGIDLTNLGLHSLRSRISLIPQNPFFFQGTLRQNLDPLESRSDPEYMKVLEEVELQDYVKSLKDGLDTDCSDASAVFSAG